MAAIRMKRIFITALLFAVVFQSGCSFRFYYVVVNSSNDPITIEYRFKKLPNAEERKKNGLTDPEYFFIEPGLKRLVELKDKSIAWRTAPENQIFRNAAKGELKITIPPGEVLQAYSDSGEAISYKGGAKNFPISDIRLAGSSGQMSFEGDLVIKQFSKLEGTIYQIQYK